MSSNKSIIIIGASGLIGQGLIKYFTDSKKNTPVIAATRSGQLGIGNTEVALDITSSKEVGAFFEKEQPEIIINVSGITSFANCEKNPKRAHQVNVVGIENILQFTKGYSPLIVQFSSNAVFGKGIGDYKEYENYSPTSVYGKTRMEAEKRVVNQSPNFIIVRTCDVFGDYAYVSRDKRFIHHLIGTLKAGEVFDVYADILSTPTYLEDVCSGLNFLIQSNYRGIIHLAGPTSVSRLDYSLAVAEAFGLNKQLLVPAKRTEGNSYHRYSNLNTEKIISLGLKLRTLTEALAHFKSKVKSVSRSLNLN